MTPTNKWPPFAPENSHPYTSSPLSLCIYAPYSSPHTNYFWNITSPALDLLIALSVAFFLTWRSQLQDSTKLRASLSQQKASDECHGDQSITSVRHLVDRKLPNEAHFAI